MAKIRGKNEGSIYQLKNKSWRAMISVGGTRQSKCFLMKKDAQDWLHEIQSQVNRGWDYRSGKTTLAEYLPQWLENHQVSLRPKTADQYRRTVEKYIVPNLGKILLKDLRLVRVEKFYSDLLKQGVGVRTINITHRILHCALEKAMRYGFIVSNPCHRAELPHAQQREMCVLDERQISLFLDAAMTSPHYALYRLAITTGMRQGELLGLKWTDLQWHNSSLLVQRQVQDIRGKGVIYQEPKTRAGKRTVMIGEDTLHILRQHWEQQQTQKQLSRNPWQENGLMFPSKVGTPMDPSNLRLDFAEVLERAGLPHIRFHDLRHTSASLMLNHNIPVIVASKRLGHSKPSITLDIYGHLYTERQSDAARIIDELITSVPVNMPTKTGEYSADNLHKTAQQLHNY